MIPTSYEKILRGPMKLPWINRSRQKLISDFAIATALVFGCFFFFTESGDLTAYNRSMRVEEHDMGKAHLHSSGLFQNVPDADWELARKYVRKHRLDIENDPSLSFKPDFVCATQLKLGEDSWVCAPEAMKSHIEGRDNSNGNGCIVYSIGDNDERFNSDVHDHIGESCEIHIFSPNEQKIEESSDNVHHHAWGIKSRDSHSVLNHKSFQDSVELLGHEDYTIDILNIDYDMIDVSDWFDSRVNIMQILVKAETDSNILAENLNIMKNQGYVKFHSSETEDGSDNVEPMNLSFLKLSQDFFDVPDEIPHNLIFTYKSHILDTKEPPLFYNNVQNTIDAYRKAWNDPDAPVIFLTDKGCEGMIQKAYPQMLYHFRHERGGALKGDICRIAALYIHGGYYFDVDLEVVTPLILPPTVSFATVQGPIDSIFFQAFVASAPKHPIIARNFEVMHDQYNQRRKNNLMGCWTMMRAYRDLSPAERGENLILKELKLGPEDIYGDLPERLGYGCCCNNLVIDPRDHAPYFYSRIRGYTNRCSFLPLEGKDAQWN